MIRKTDRHPGPTTDVLGAKAGRLACNRRELLTVAGALVSTLGLSNIGLAQTVAPISESAFRDLSVALTGFVPPDPGLSAAFRDSFSTELANLTKLYEIVRDSDPEDWTKEIASADLGDLAETLITAWYTGIVGEGKDQQVVTYLNALVWYAVGYTKPPSACDTDFGAWANRPNGDF